MKCAICGCWKNRRECKSLSSETYCWFHVYLKLNGKRFDKSNLFYCKGCTNALYSIKRETVGDYDVETDDSSVESMSLDSSGDSFTLDNVWFASGGHKICIICRTEVKAGVTVMPNSARLDLFLIHRIFAPHGSRCCRTHLFDNNRLKPIENIDNINRSNSPASFSPEAMRTLMNDVFSLFDELRSSPRLDFEDPMLTNDEYLMWTGWSKEQFDMLFDQLSSAIRSSSNRSSRNALAIFWIKLKTNLSFCQIGSLFNFPGDSDAKRLRVGDAFDAVRESLMKIFVPKYLGIGHITQLDTFDHNTAYSKVRAVHCNGETRERKFRLITSMDAFPMLVL